MSSGMNSEPRFYISDVFLSFRGEDTRASFISHLYAALRNAGVNVFKDDESLQRGEEISRSLLRTIEQSRISVVVFSKNYADSRWCLEELKKILSCRRTMEHVVVPVFYDVDPSEVRRQTGEFGEAYQRLSNRLLKEVEGARRWSKFIYMARQDLYEAANIAGVVVLNSGNESEAVKNIVESVTRLLDKTELFIADNPVGVEPRVQEMINLLELTRSNDVLLVGMWGMGGVGKTTIAKAIYNKIGRDFEGKSFLANIREVWGQDTGQVTLQEQLLFDIDKDTKTKIRNVESGKIILKERLCFKNVFVVLDDVNELGQLNALCGSREWFCPGSRIIITTRDQHILKGTRVDKRYIMKGMDESESLELFSWHAFKQPTPRENLTELSRNVTAYSGGLPLALEVLGCYLYDMEVIEWESVLEKLKRIPNHEVQKKLKISYDGLNYDTEREIFSDIACFFIGMDRSDVIQILNDCGFFAEDGIRVLVERSLVTVNDKNKLGMHDLLRDMGREIIREKSPQVPEERSRLWFSEDVLDVLSKGIGTKAIEGLTLKLAGNNNKCFSTKAFKKMKRLRLLQLAGVGLDGDFKFLSNNLRWLSWHGFPLKCVPTSLYQQSLVSIELQNSNVRLMWIEAQMMEKLKIFNLSHSHCLTQTPDFSKLPNLEKLELINCSMLSEVSHTIGLLGKVVLINLKDCISLRNLPRSIYKLKSLKTLILSGCLKIDKLEEDLEQMESLTVLVADKTAIKTVPFSIIRSKSIGYISLCGYEGLSHDVFPSIIWSWMSPTNSLSSHINQTFVDMSSLVSLDVPNSKSHHLSYIFEDLPKLQSLCIECGSKLQLSQETKSILDVLYATNSEELNSDATTSQVPNMNAFTLIECNSQMHISESKCSLRSLLIQMGISCQVTHNLRQSILQSMSTTKCGDCELPGDNHPDWFTFNNKDSSVNFEIPHVNGRNLKTLMCHVHYSSPENITSDGLKNLLLINHTKSTIQLYKRDALISSEEEEWQRLISNTEPGNEVEVVVVFGSRLIVNKTIVYLIYAPMDEKIEQHNAPIRNVSVSSDENVSAAMLMSPQVSNKFGGGGGLSNVQCQACNKFGHVAASCNHGFVSQSNFQFHNQLPWKHATERAARRERKSDPRRPALGSEQQAMDSNQQRTTGRKSRDDSQRLRDNIDMRVDPPSNQQQYHFSYMPSTQVQPQIPLPQHSRFQAVPYASVAPTSCPQPYITNTALSHTHVQQSQNWFVNSGASHHVTSNPTNLVQHEPIRGFPIHPNYVAQSNFQFQNQFQFPWQHAAEQPIFPPFQGSCLPHQQLYHSSYMHPTHVPSLQQSHHQIPLIQHSQLQTRSSASVRIGQRASLVIRPTPTSVPPMSFPQPDITNLDLSQDPAQQSHNR